MLIGSFKTVLQTLFRLLPFPTRTGLRVVGAPGPDSPVFVTCNYDLTVRRVLEALKGLDCYVLVAPSKGINVWCAAGGGMFNAHSVTSAVKTSRIGERVNHRRLILPQLSAPGIDVTRVEQESGWRCAFGPVYARDIPAFVASNFCKTDEMRRVKFPLRDRIEMAVMWAGMLSAVVVIPLAIFGAGSMPGALALIWGFSLFLFVFYAQVLRFVPGPTGIIKVGLLGLVGVAIVVAYGLTLGAWSTASLAGWSLAVLIVALVLGFDLDGSSPLHAGSTAAYWSRKWPAILKLWNLIGYEIEETFSLSVDKDLCRGCLTCVTVCPKGVFEMVKVDGRQKAQLGHPAECELCTACVKQCPEGAILAEPPIRLFGEIEVHA